MKTFVQFFCIFKRFAEIPFDLPKIGNFLRKVQKSHKSQKIASRKGKILIDDHNLGPDLHCDFYRNLVTLHTQKFARAT